MLAEKQVFGAYAAVVIHFSGSLGELAHKLGVALNVVIDVGVDEYPPHLEIGSCEALGWEVWLKPADELGLYSLRCETEHANEEILQSRLHDLSLWFARYLAMMCDLPVVPQHRA